MKSMIWRTCLNHNGSLCHPEVRWCEFFPDPQPPAQSPFDPLEEICRICPHVVPVIRENRCPFCAGNGMRWGSPKSVLTSRPEPEYLYHYMCQHCGKDVFSKDLIFQ
jgi:hypothetical protein